MLLSQFRAACFNFGLGMSEDTCLYVSTCNGIGSLSVSWHAKWIGENHSGTRTFPDFYCLVVTHEITILRRPSSFSGEYDYLWHSHTSLIQISKTDSAVFAQCLSTHVSPSAFLRATRDSSLSLKPPRKYKHRLSALQLIVDTGSLCVINHWENSFVTYRKITGI